MKSQIAMTFDRFYDLKSTSRLAHPQSTVPTRGRTAGVATAAHTTRKIAHSGVLQAVSDEIDLDHQSAPKAAQIARMGDYGHPGLSV